MSAFPDEGGPLQRLSPKKTAVVVIDIQERLAPAMPKEDLDGVVRAVRILVEGARLFGAPVLASEQYPRGLGRTVAEVEEALIAAGASRFEKMEFSACDASGFREALRGAAVTSAVVLGMESHVCVFQTVRDLVELGVETYVPVDGVCSRRRDHRDAGLELCVRAGAVRTTAESVAFDWLRKAGTDEFRRLSKLIR